MKLARKSSAVTHVNIKWREICSLVSNFLYTIFYSPPLKHNICTQSFVLQVQRVQKSEVKSLHLPVYFDLNLNLIYIRM